MKGCNHRFNDSDSTLKMLPKRELTFPQIFYFQCEECNKFFKVKKNQKGKFVKVNDTLF